MTEISSSGEKLEKACTKVLDQSFEAICDFDAEELLHERIAALKELIPAGMPRELVERRERAVELTNAAAEVAEQCLAVWEIGQHTPRIDDARLLRLAEAQLKLRDPAQDASPVLIEATKNQLAHRLQMAAMADTLPPVWYCLFYRAIVEDLGSDLENTARQQQLSRMLPEMALTLLETATGIGILSIAKTIFGAVAGLASKRKAILEMSTDMARKFEMIRDYLDNYCAAVEAWTSAAERANDVMTTNASELQQLLLELVTAVKEGKA